MYATSFRFRSYDIRNANYIVGFPDDDYESMTDTLSLALELNTEMINIYPCQALPGSPLYIRAIKEGWDLPAHMTNLRFCLTTQSYQQSI